MDENGDMSELLACTSVPVDPGGFNPHAILPYGCTVEHIQQTMSEFIDFLSFLDQQLYTKGIKRIESMLMPANFSSMVCEFIISTLPKHCSGIAKNQYHDGHPDLVPGNLFANDSVQHAEEGIEIMGSRYPGGWQGQNPGNTWLMVFVFDGNRSVDASKGSQPKPFRFMKVVGAHLSKNDWKLSGRKPGSRHIGAASILPSGYDKMMANWIYRAPGYEQQGDEDDEDNAKSPTFT